MRRLRGCSALLVLGLLSGTPVVAQPVSKPVRIGIMADPSWPATEGLRDGMRDLGYVEGQNLRLEYRWAARPDFRTMAEELVALDVAAIVTWGAVATLTAHEVSTTVPIVMATMGEVVSERVAATLARPSGNVTGSLSLTSAANSKRLELLREIAPAARRIAVLSNSANPTTPINLQNLSLGLGETGLTILPVSIDDGDIERALGALLEARAEAVVVTTDPVLLANRRRLIEFMKANRLPAAYGMREYVEEGGLVSYGAQYRELFRRAAGFIDKILKGAKPGDLPIQQAERFDLWVNGKTAAALGLAIPPAVLARADEVIE
jgi:putative ABC transport system substrate-binding protein